MQYYYVRYITLLASIHIERVMKEMEICRVERYTMYSVRFRKHLIEQGVEAEPIIDGAGKKEANQHLMKSFHLTIRINTLLK